MTAGDDARGTIRDRVTAESKVSGVIAVPKGAGKTTFVETFLHDLGLRIVNPDAIARALFPDSPADAAYEAARAADAVRADLVARGVSFCTETVFSDAGGLKLAFLREARAHGYMVVFVFIGLESSELAIGRVLQRIEQGGHDVPDEKIQSRFARTLANLSEALTFVDHAFVFDNSSAEQPYRLVAELRAGRVVRRGDVKPQWWIGLLR